MTDLTTIQPRGTGDATVHWLDQHGGEQEEPATRDLLRRELYAAPKPIRTGNRYPRQRNYHGMYFMESAGKHVWFESLLEESGLARLDMGSRIVQIASQPMKIVFPDGSEHFPDFLALYDTHRQVLFDVKPSSHMTDKVVAQFEKTRAVADRIGWGYAIIHELPRVQLNNLKWLRQFKHPGFRPPPANVSLLLGRLVQPLQVIEAAAALSLPTLAEGRSALFHLIWDGTLAVDMTRTISDRSIVKRGDDDDA